MSKVPSISCDHLTVYEGSVSLEVILMCRYRSEIRPLMCGSLLQMRSNCDIWLSGEPVLMKGVQKILICRYRKISVLGSPKVSHNSKNVYNELLETRLCNLIKLVEDQAVNDIRNFQAG